MMDRDAFAEIVEKLNDDQKRAVFCDANCVVTAGAGSGKTTVLSYRFLRLVVEGRANVDEILTLTFSRAAATEMQERIHRTLHTYQDDQDIHRQLKRFSDATITTIDSFCNRIVASDPTRYGIGPDFVLDEDANREMASECAYRLFSQMEGHDGLKFLATLYNPDDLIDSLFIGLAFNQFHPSSYFNAEEQRRLLSEYLHRTYREALGESFTIARKIVDLDGSGKTFEKNADQLHDLLVREDDLLNSLDPKIALTILESVKMRKCTGKKEFVGLCNEFIERFKEQFRIASLTCAALCSESLLGPIYEVLETFQRLYLATKRERGILTFGDIAHMARDILLYNLSVRRYFQRKYRYIMIDEFQDTNQLQRDIIYLVAQDQETPKEGLPTATDLKNDKLFIVGDEKQSIYRFRGADVSVFKAVEEEIVTAGGKPINLPMNYRSEPALIGFFNKVFEQVMADAHYDFEATFESLESRPPIEDLQPRIDIFFKKLPEEEDQTDDENNVLAVQAEAYTIGETIKNMVYSDDYLVQGHDGLRRPLYSDIAILFRTSSNQMHYEKALRLAGIPYTISAVQSLFLEAPANDMYQLLQLVVFPDDRLAFTAALRSPLCRISDDSLLILLDAYEEHTAEAFFDAANSLPNSSDRVKYEACRTLFHQLVEIAKEGSVSTLVSHIWYEGGYRHYLLSDPLYQVYLEHFDFLHELAIQYDMADRGLPAFLDFVRPRLGQKQKLSDVEPLRDHTDGVQLMTVHKSKGLEFPIVILANMGGEPRGGSAPAWVERDGLIVPRHMKPYDKVTNVIYERDKLTLRAMETAEMKRLFYVALTRAKAHVLLFGCQNVRNLGESSRDKNFMALLFASTGILENPGLFGQHCQIHDIPDAPLSVLRSGVSKENVDLAVHRMAKFYQDPLPPRQYSRLSFAVTEFAHNRPLGGQETEELHLDLLLPSVEADPMLIEYHLEASFGSWVHLLLQKSLSSFIEGLPEARITEEDALLCMPLEMTRLELGRQREKILIGSALLLVNNFLSSRFFAELLDNGPIALESEVPFIMRWENPEPILLRGSIDLLLRYRNCTRVIDFKTDAYRQPEQHEAQLEIYGEAAKRLYDLPVYTDLFYLRGVENWFSLRRDSLQQQ